MFVTNNNKVTESNKNNDIKSRKNSNIAMEGINNINRTPITFVNNEIEFRPFTPPFSQCKIPSPSFKSNHPKKILKNPGEK